MTVLRKITGYDKRTERLELAFDLSDDDIVDLQLTDETSWPAGALPLSRDLAATIASRLNLPLEALDRYDWLIEPFAAEEAVSFS